MCLKVNLDAVPVKIHISRNSGIISPTEISDTEKQHGKRTVLFKVPFNKVSSFDAKKNKNGNMLLTINENSIIAEDLKSSNGSRYFKLSTEVGDEFRNNGALLGQETLSCNWGVMFSREVINGEELDQPIELESPLLLELGAEFLLLVI